jgi:hydrogenase maturation protease
MRVETDCHTLVIGCGNLLRADDGVGPVLIRHMWERGLPPGVRLADGGTAGMDVAFQMRGAQRVILIDACCSDSEPGTLFRVPGEELEDLPPLEGLHSHSFRWDHALAFARWLLKDEYPTDILVYLIEAGNLDPGMELTPPVEKTMHALIDTLLEELREGSG